MITLAWGKLDDATAVTAHSRNEVDNAAAAAEQAPAERDEVVTRTALLSKSLADLQEGARHLRSLEEARRDMMRDLIGRGRVLCERF